MKHTSSCLMYMQYLRTTAHELPGIYFFLRGSNIRNSYSHHFAYSIRTTVAIVLFWFGYLNAAINMSMSCKAFF